MLNLRLLALFSLTLPLAAQDPVSPEPKQRIKAIREYAKQGPQGIESLRRMLHDADTSVRLEAVKGLAEVGTQASLDPLIEASHDNDGEVQIRAAAGLVNFYLPGYIQSRFDRLGTALKSKFVEQPDQVIPAYVTVREDVIAALASLVKGGSSMESRASAARAVGILRGKAALPSLIEALHSKDGDVLYESLSAIQKIRDPSAGPRIAFLLEDHEDKVQIAALETVGLLRSQETLPDVRRALERARNEKIRRAALSSIALMPQPADRALFDRYRTDKDENLRASAAEGYGRLQNPEDLASLHKDFDNEAKMKPRLADAFAVVRLGATETSEFSPLQYLVNTLNSKAYKGIAEAYLIELTRQPQVRENLYPLLKGATKAEKIGLGTILAGSGDKNSVAPLQELTKDNDAEVAEASLRALRVLKARLP